MDLTDYSFKKLSEKDGIITYYTNPIKTFLTSTDEILTYYNNALSSIGEKKWVWIFDSEGFELQHALGVHIGIKVSRLITGKYGNNLQEIKIINPTWHIKTIIKAIWPFLNDITKQKINIMNNRVYSVLEFI